MEMLKEKIEKFLSVSCNYGTGCGYGGGTCECFGYGYGSGRGGCFGDGSGAGCSVCYRENEGNDYGFGYGYGYNHAEGLKQLNHQNIYYIDNIPTIITSIKNNIAKGFIVDGDNFTKTHCYVAKVYNYFAHAPNIRQAIEEAQNKYFGSLDVKNRIAEFVKTFNNVDKYPAQDFFTWHNILTGSCLMGRNEFVKRHGYDLDNDTFTVKEFISICENDFGGDIIKQLKKYYM